MTNYQTITVEPSVPRRVFVPDGALLGVSDPQGGQPFTLGLEEGASVEVVASTAPEFAVGNILRRACRVSPGRRRPAALTLRACRSQWVEVCTAPAQADGVFPPPLAPETALRLRMPLASPDARCPDLPEPLAPVVAEYRIEGATAIAYCVKAGQYIQIVNVEGSQCADFLAFAGAGFRGELDGATTRTLNGLAMPRAGLHGKYFSQEMRPLVEVIQDTCGRHDSFLLACTDDYYADQGYPGHASCTTNFNLNLHSYKIAPRRGWPAVNFFFNTEVQNDGAIVSGESWARPGDYVLMRAATDLLCATSSCADDIDPVNGWNPTPIHVRVYDADRRFPRASGLRLSQERPVRLTRETAFTPSLRALTDDFTDVGGTWLPNSFAHHGELAEYWALRERVAVMDLSALRKFEVYGPDAETLLQTAFSRDVAKIAAGQSAYGCLLTPHGGILDDGLVFHLGPDSYRYVGNCETDGDWLRRIAVERDWDVLVKSSSDHWHNLAVQGPLALDVLRPLIAFAPESGVTALDHLGYFRFAAGQVGGMDVLVSRTGYTGERGYELFVHPDNGAALWDTVWEAGQCEGMLPLGMKALDRARIEAGLLSPGREFDSSISPFQAGLVWAVAMRKPDFIGRSALEQIQPHPPLAAVGLTLEGSEVAPVGRHVYCPGQDFPAGTITSATFSPVLNRSIALAQVFPEYARHGAGLEVRFVDGMARRVSATVGPLAAYDPKKLRVKA